MGANYYIIGIQTVLPATKSPGAKLGLANIMEDAGTLNFRAKCSTTVPGPETSAGTIVYGFDPCKQGHPLFL
jgi:hypothetical protein